MHNTVPWKRMGFTTTMSNDEVKTSILQLLRSVNRPNIEELIAFLEKSDFFSAPASTRYHLACAGGLARHSLNVYYRLMALTTTEADTFNAWTKEELAEKQDSIILVSLLHDMCKIDFYKASTRNVKNEKTGQWEKVPCYTIENSLPLGHGEKSVYMASGFIKLTREETMAIRWHMGAWDDAVKGGCRDVNAAFEQYPLACLLHIADMMASNLDEVEKKEKE